jgi:DNA polymerase III delta prime subunit
MTHLIIHHDKVTREQEALKLISELLGKKITEFDQLYKIPDLHIIKSEDNSITIEEVKDLIKSVMYKPFEEKYQIGLIIDAQKLTTEAQNALLKNLEEQPDQTAFILTVDNEKHLLDTIASRCVKQHIKDNTYSETTSEVEIDLSKDIVSLFNDVEKLAELERNEILTVLENLQLQTREKLHNEESSTITTNTNILRQVEVAKKRISGNGNKRLVLENMIVQIK